MKISDFVFVSVMVLISVSRHLGPLVSSLITVFAFNLGHTHGDLYLSLDMFFDKISNKQTFLLDKTFSDHSPCGQEAASIWVYLCV